jgi:hypothetical protein
MTRTTRLRLIKEHPIDEAHERQFFESYGRAMLSWQSIELELVFVFQSIMRAHDHRIASAAYHAITNLNTRLEMITESLKVALPDASLQQEWTKLRKKIGERAAKRNLLAHYTLGGHVTEDSTTATMRLERSLYDARDKDRQQIDLKQLAEYERQFHELTGVIRTFSRKVRAALPR